MKNDCVYVIDSCVLIAAARSYYAFDLVPSFWRCLLQQAEAGRLLSIDRVKDEIDRQSDELTSWVNWHFHRWFASTRDNNVLEVYGWLQQWANSNSQFLDHAKREFAEETNADPWLVAYAKVMDYVVVTNEVFRPTIRGSIKIPNACEAFGVRYVNTFQMLRALNVILAR